MPRSLSRLLLLALLFLLPGLACNFGAGNAPAEEEPTIVIDSTPAIEPTEPAEPVEPVAADQAQEAGPAPVVDGPVDNLQDARQAVVQIVARGTFIDPEVGLQLNSAGSGSGFIVDPSGLAVTNNHVVTGAAALDVYLQGEASPRNARIVAVSECSDLALIDIDGEDFPYLTWYDGPINVGLDVYAAGFPLGDPEYTLTRGIVAKEQAAGDTPWASVNGVIQHDATINPGNSGGPLIDANGRVVGVNYAGAEGVDQYFAIARDEATRIVEQLQAGQDVDSLGINGTAVSDGQDLYGIWVASVESGSPADRARIEAGDILTALEGLELATDGTMRDYCNILRTRGPDETFDVQVLRFATSELLEGQINGRELEVALSFADTLGDEVADNTGGAYTYTTISDDSGLLTVDVPTVWSDINGSAWTLDGEEIGVAVSAAPNLDDFLNTWTTPGMFFGASSRRTETPDQLLDSFDYSDVCTYEGRDDYSDGLYFGLFDTWGNCDDSGSVYLVVAAQPEDESFIILVTIQVVTDADLEALDQILATFIVNV